MLRHRAARPPSFELTERGFSKVFRHVHEDDPRTRWKLNLPPSSEGLLPRLTWSSTPSGDWLTAEVSVPKMLYSSNVRMVTDADIARALDRISNFVSKVTGVEFDAYTTLVGCVDYCFNFPVGEANILPFIAAASYGSLPRMRRVAIEDTTVTWESKDKCKSKVVKLYGKHREVESRIGEKNVTDDELRDAIGLLRLEVSFRRAATINRLAEKFGHADRIAAHLLTEEIALSVLTDTLEALGLNQPIASTDSRLDILREHYGDTATCRRLVAFLAFLDRYGESFWRHGFGGYKRSAYYRDAKALKEAGVWLKTPSQRALPPLRLVWDADRDARAVRK